MHVAQAAPTGPLTPMKRNDRARRLAGALDSQKHGAACRRRRNHYRQRREAVTISTSRAPSCATAAGQSRQRRTLAQHDPSSLRAVAGAASATSAAAGSPPRKRAPRRRRGRPWPGRGMSPLRSPLALRGCDERDHATQPSTAPASWVGRSLGRGARYQLMRAFGSSSGETSIVGSAGFDRPSRESWLMNATSALLCAYAPPVGSSPGAS